MAQRKLEEAISPLKKLYAENTANANINFLMGAAYTEIPGNDKKAAYHLKKAIQSVSTDYTASSFEEKNAPVFSYYYLAVALVGNEKCAEAERAIEELEKYKDIAGEYYIKEAKMHLQKCNFDVYGDFADNWNKSPEELPEDYNPIAFSDKEKNTRYLPIDSIIAMGKGQEVEKIEYTTNAPLYGVQIGSTSKVIPSSRFGDLKNVDAFIDKSGIVRYVIGHFAHKKQAETLLKSIKEKGYGDAFVVNVNDERKYSYAVVSYNKNTIDGPIEFMVQLGAFEKDISDELISAYFKADNIQELRYGGKTLITTENFSSYENAETELKEMKSTGFKDAFIVAFNKGKKLPLQDAINYSHQ